MQLYAILTWLGMMLLAILNGLLRERFFRTRFDELTAHQISTIVLLLLLTGYCALLAQSWPLHSMTEAWTVGVIWLALTLLFECGFGHYVAKHPWRRLLADYNLLAGRIWVLIPLWMLIAPSLLLLHH